MAILAFVLVIGGTIGGTMAWLMDKTDSVENTFTYGDINIDLSETTGTTYKILPGNDISKDPKVTVEAGSEASWLFVKIEEINWPIFMEEDGTTRKVNYAVSEGWTELTGETGVYYREAPAAAADTNYSVLLNNVVNVSDELTKSEINGVTLQPVLKFTAYAVQNDEVNLTTAAEAWTVANSN